MFSVYISNNKIIRRFKKMADRLLHRSNKKEKPQFIKPEKEDILFI